MTACYAYEGQHYLRNRHLDGCDGGDCAGCEQCGQRHCGECRKGTHLAFGENTCPECIAATRRDLHVLVELYAALPDEVETKGVNSEAANLHGPFADPEAFAWRRAAKANREHVLLSSLEGDDENHPLSVLKRWVQALCEDYGDDYDRGDTIASLTDWIDARLGRIAHDVGQDFGLFKRELRHVRAHMEAVLHAGEQVERGVTCPSCETDEGVEKALKLTLRRSDKDRTGASDVWVCPIDRTHQWTEAEYRHRVGNDYVRHAPELTMDHLQKRTGVPASTLRRWASRQWNKATLEYDPPLLRARGRSHDGRKTYRVEDAEKLRGADTAA